jgi:hypothetical protein
MCFVVASARNWPQKFDTGAWWAEEDCQEYIQQHFSIKHIAKYFRTRSPVSATDIDGWHARGPMAPLFMGEMTSFRDSSKTM